MVYLTTPQAERYKTPTAMDIINGRVSKRDLQMYDASGSVTRTLDDFNDLESNVKYNFIHDEHRAKETLKAWHESVRYQLWDGNTPDDLNKELKENHYHSFKVAKKTGGLRQIDAPNEELKSLQRHLLSIITSFVPRAYHTNAFAYVKNRSTYDAVVRHQKWESNWFAHFDFSNFFGSTTKEFILNSMKKQVPFCDWARDAELWGLLSDALDYCLVDGVMPQGATSSPGLTNLMMIPFDYQVTKALHDFPSSASKLGKDRFIYTRYADDIHISCRVDFRVKEVENFLNDVLSKEGAPFTIKPEKTHYGNRSGQNWMLGYVLNANNEISIGAKNKKMIKAMVHAFACDHKNQILWDKGDLQTVLGKLSYWSQHEKDTVAYVLTKVNEKHGFDVMEAIKEDMLVAV